MSVTVVTRLRCTTDEHDPLLVDTLTCAVCTRLEANIRGLKSFSSAWISGSNNHRTSNIVDHAKSDFACIYCQYYNLMFQYTNIKNMTNDSTNFNVTFVRSPKKSIILSEQYALFKLLVSFVHKASYSKPQAFSTL